MTFSKVKGPGWAVGEQLTSAQMNQLDTDHAKAVDGTGGGTYTLTAPLVLNGANVSVGQDLAVGDDLTVADDANIGGDATVVGQLAGGLITTENLRAPGFVEFSAGPGWDGLHNILMGDDPVFIYIDDGDVSAPRTWTISNTGARDGQFFFFKNASSHDITINSPSQTPMIIVAAGDALISWRGNSIWRAMLVSPT